MKLLFWNLGKKDNGSIARNAIETFDIDLAFFAEFNQTNLADIVHALGHNYILHDGYGGCDKITLIANRIYKVSVLCESTRYSIYSIRRDSSQYIIGAAHLPDPRNANKEDRKKVIRDFVHDIALAEHDQDCDNTLIIGDFNASPFDEELVQKDCFNAVLFRELIMNQEYVDSYETRYRRLYNPIIDYVSEEQKNYGSFYYSSGIKTLYWYSYDQILLRKPLVESFQRMKYLRRIKDQSLITEYGIPNKISDHLPLYVEMK